MKVILQENIDGLGYLGDVLDVAKGYARNYLLPRKKAVVANERQEKMFEHLKRQVERKAKEELMALTDFGKKLSGVSLTFEVQTGKDNKLFGSVTTKDIAEQLAAKGIEVDRRKIQLAQPIKELGTFSVPVKLHREIVSKISVTVAKKDGEAVAAPEVVESAPFVDQESEAE
ncbi:MAG: 50S ribosomal protein L9 [Nitrospirales bacterium]|nr:50S ribosomal protein L9 [Nitrospirales bacterium]